jgi:hypothetical protein
MNTIIDKLLTYASETWILTERDRKQLNIFERKVYRRILGSVYDNENRGHFYKFKKTVLTGTFGSKKTTCPGNRCTVALCRCSPWERHQKVPKSYIL